ncbi:MAG TPA: HAD hydrolase family protein, partial [Solirubrobacterales bacterium]|nr:HAD hydrolase family protein [Solirubrobacterales bacterium]
MPLRCVYTDLDGTLLGRYGSLFRDSEGEFSLLQARALEACHRAGVEVVVKSGRREGSVVEDAKLMGLRSYIAEVGTVVMIDGERTELVGDIEPDPGKSLA